jgi:hypothetical protein
MSTADERLAGPREKAGGWETSTNGGENEEEGKKRRDHSGYEMHCEFK